MSPWSGTADRSQTEVTVDGVTGRGVSTVAAALVTVIGDPSWLDVPFGSTITVHGRLAPAEPAEAPVAMLLADEPPRVTGPPGLVLRVVNTIRDELLVVTEDLSPQGRGLVPGVAIGDTSRIEPDLDQALLTTSLTHVTAVSGGHFAIIVATITALCAMARAPRLVRALATAVVMSGFVTLVHPEPSVLRAAAMGAVGLVAIVLGRPSRALPALGATVIVLLVADPWLARSYGFALSTAATAGLVLGTQPIARRLEPWLGKVGAFALAVPVAAQLGCAPIIVLLDPSVALYSVPANLVAAPALAPATILGVLAALLAPLWPVGAFAVGWLASCATWWIATVAELFASLPGARLPWLPGTTGAVLLAVITVLALLFAARWRLLARLAGLRVPWSQGSGWPLTWRVAMRGSLRDALRARRRREVRRAALGGVVVLALLVSGVVFAWPRWIAPAGRDIPADWVLVACDVGQGDGMVLRTGEGSGLMVDVGPATDAAGECLDRIGVTHLDLLVLTHFHADHVGGLDAVLRGRTVDRALVTGLASPAGQAEQVHDALDEQGVRVETAVAGSAGKEGDVSWEVLWAGEAADSSGGAPDAGGGPSEESDSGEDAGANDASIALSIQAHGLSIVALGDLEEEGQAAVDRALRARGEGNVDVAKVAHHGSRVQSERLAQTLSPSVGIVSSGRTPTVTRPIPPSTSTGARAPRSCGPISVGRSRSSCEAGVVGDRAADAAAQQQRELGGGALDALAERRRPPVLGRGVQRGRARAARAGRRTAGAAARR